MENQETKIPFYNAGEAAFHIDMSNVLGNLIKDRILEMDDCDEESREILKGFIENSLIILIDGHINLLMSIQQGYLI